LAQLTDPALAVSCPKSNFSKVFLKCKENESVLRFTYQKKRPKIKNQNLIKSK
jgi:hypothetical protein